MVKPQRARNGKLSRHRRRALLKGAGAAAIGTLAPLSFPAIGQQTKVRYTLSWLPTGQYAFVYMARQLGFWKKRGIHVEISRGLGSVGARNGVGGDKWGRGGAGSGAIVLSVMRGLDLQMVGTQGYESYMGILVPANGPIKAPKDPEATTIGATAAGGDTPFFPAYCKAAGVDASTIKLVSLDSQIIEQSVIKGQ